MGIKSRNNLSVLEFGNAIGKAINQSINDWRILYLTLCFIISYTYWESGRDYGISLRKFAFAPLLMN